MGKRELAGRVVTVVVVRAAKGVLRAVTAVAVVKGCWAAAAVRCLVGRGAAAKVAVAMGCSLRILGSRGSLLSPSRPSRTLLAVCRPKQGNHECTAVGRVGRVGTEAAVAAAARVEAAGAPCPVGTVAARVAVAGKVALEVAREPVAAVAAVTTVVGARAGAAKGAEMAAARAVKQEAARWVEATAVAMTGVARAATVVEVAGAPCLGRREAAVVVQKVTRR